MEYLDNHMEEEPQMERGTENALIDYNDNEALHLNSSASLSDGEDPEFAAAALEWEIKKRVLLLWFPQYCYLAVTFTLKLAALIGAVIAGVFILWGFYGVILDDSDNHRKLYSLVVQLTVLLFWFHVIRALIVIAETEVLPSHLHVNLATKQICMAGVFVGAALPGISGTDYGVTSVCVFSLLCLFLCYAVGLSVLAVWIFRDQPNLDELDGHNEETSNLSILGNVSLARQVVEPTSLLHESRNWQPKCPKMYYASAVCLFLLAFTIAAAIAARSVMFVIALGGEQRACIHWLWFQQCWQ